MPKVKQAKSDHERPRLLTNDGLNYHIYHETWGRYSKNLRHGISVPLCFVWARWKEGHSRSCSCWCDQITTLTGLPVATAPREVEDRTRWKQLTRGQGQVLRTRPSVMKKATKKMLCLKQDCGTILSRFMFIFKKNISNVPGVSWIYPINSNVISPPVNNSARLNWKKFLNNHNTVIKLHWNA